MLLDSHVFLWFDYGDSKLPDPVRNQIETAKEVFVSAATIWELSIKRSRGKLPGLRGSLLDIARKHDLALLPITPEHAEEVSSLPRLHRDPFDHLLLAQVRLEKLTLVTHDNILARYGVPVLLV